MMSFMSRLQGIQLINDPGNTIGNNIQKNTHMQDRISSFIMVKSWEFSKV